MLGNVLAIFIALLMAGISAQAIFNIRLRLFIWEDPEHAWLNRAPGIYRSPHLSFTILLPARHEEDVYRETIQKIYELNYPKELMQIIAICREDDPGTISEALAKINELNDPNLQLLVFNDKPINKPHGLNLGLQVAEGDVVTIFDAEDEPHRDILNIVNTILLNEETDAVQSGVQLMNHNTRWFCFLNVLEYFFWFKSALHFFARIGMIPLGGNTVFVRREILEQVGGWDEHCLTEDADLGIRLSVGGARIRVIYDDAYVTREETPISLGQFIKQRPRWNQGFIQVLLKGDWLRLETFGQRVLAFYVLVMPEVQALFALLVPVSLLTILFLHFPLWLALLTFLPLGCLVLSVVIELAGLREFKKSHSRAWSWREALTLVLSFFPYQLVLGFSAMRAVYRQVHGARDWEKTSHVGQHRDLVGMGLGVSGVGEPEAVRPA
jgi:cellulose synthase/poly-beta-1,6-N-acetylglucosamine synthase-like glycosyltransferase